MRNAKKFTFLNYSLSNSFSNFSKVHFLAVSLLLKFHPGSTSSILDRD